MPAAEWHVLGAGAIGGLFAAHLARAGVRCTLLQRQPGHGSCPLLIETDGGITETALPCSPVSAVDPISHVLVTTKAHQALDALAGLHHRLDAGATVLLLMNGMGLSEEVGRLLPDARIYCGTTTEGAYRRSRYHIVHAGRGTTLLGSLDGHPAPAWFSSWEAAELSCHWTDDIAAMMWRKLAVNCAINPLTAIHRCRNGELIADPDLRRAMDALCDEIVDVSSALGFTDTASNLHTAVAQVAAATAENRSSMLQDVSAGRPTEIDYITGYLVARAAAAGIAVPRNRAVLEAIRRD